jgi:predicted site-specific integrase-resolvase
MMIRLTEWAAQQGIAYITAFKWSQRGKVPGLHRAVSGRLFVEVPDPPVGREVALYGRVSSADQKADLDRQMARLRDFASAHGLVVGREVQDVGSGLNGHRKRLVALLADPSIGVLVVEHRDRLARFGVDYVEAALRAQGRQLVVLNEGEQKLDMVQDFVDVVTSMCARIYGQRAAKNRAHAALAAAAAVP